MRTELELLEDKMLEKGDIKFLKIKTEGNYVDKVWCATIIDISEFVEPSTLIEFYSDFLVYSKEYNTISSNTPINIGNNFDKIRNRDCNYTGTQKLRSFLDIYRLSYHYYKCTLEEFIDLILSFKDKPIVYYCCTILKCILGREGEKYGNMYNMYRDKYGDRKAKEFGRRTFGELIELYYINKINKKMKMEKEILLAVYGTLKQGHGNHRYLKNAEYLGTHITEPNYTMHSMGGFPAVTLEGSTPISMEIYKVTDKETIENVNALEGYSGQKDSPRNWYDCVTINTPYGEAEMYYFKNCDTKVVENGIW